MDMRILAMIPDGAEFAQPIEAALLGCIPVENIEIVHNSSVLVENLGHWPDDPPVLVLYADAERTLTSLVTFRYLISDFRIILILPHDGKAIVAVGHMLQPRVIVFANEAAGQLPVLLGKMCEQQEARHRTSHT